jgi:hypothetical protein
MRKRYKILEVAREDEGDCGDSSGASDRKIRPSIKEADRFAIDLPKVLVESAGLRHLSRQLALRKGAKERENTRDKPDKQQHTGVRKIARHLGWRCKNAGANDRTYDNGGRGI